MRRVDVNVGVGRKRERGTVMVLIAGSVVVLLLFGALALDVGLVWSTRTQNQNVDDAAALAAANHMIDPTGPSVTLAEARQKARETALLNESVGEGPVTVLDSDITFGFYDLRDGSFDTGVDLTDPDVVTGARVNVRRDGTDNSESPAFLAGLLGLTGNPARRGFTVNNTAIGYLGFDGDFFPGEFDLPIAIDSCNLTSDNGCGDDFCANSQTPDNPCLLSPGAQQVGDASTGAGDVTCLDFSPTPDQNACWTDFGDDPTVSTPSLKGVVDNGNAGDVGAGDYVNLDNGDKTSVQKYIAEAMYGEGSFSGNPRGEDRYPDAVGTTQSIDSWVVKLPVVECQDTAHCAGGDNFQITGGVCFQVREVTGPPDRLVKGRFLCPDDPDPDVRDLYESHCADPPGDQDRPGGCNFGDRAEQVVLVE